MIDRLLETLVGSGPLGILCGVLLTALGIAAKIISDVFKLYQEAQEKRIEEALEAQKVTQQQIAIIQGIKELLQSQRH